MQILYNFLAKVKFLFLKKDIINAHFKIMVMTVLETVIIFVINYY